MISDENPVVGYAQLDMLSQNMSVQNIPKFNPNANKMVLPTDFRVKLVISKRLEAFHGGGPLLLQGLEVMITPGKPMVFSGHL